MAQNTYKTKDMTSLYIQANGPNTLPEYLGCYDLDDVSADNGGINLSFCFDANGNWVVSGYTDEAPSPITTVLTTGIGKLSEYLETAVCPFDLHINFFCGGKKDIFTNWERALILTVVKVTNRTLKSLVKRDVDEFAMQTFDVTALPPFVDVFRLIMDQQDTTETRAANDIFFLDNARCAGCNGPAIAEGQYGFISTDGAPAVTANVLLTTDGGANWAAAAADPFAVAEDIQPIVAVMLTPTTYRIIAGRGTTDAGNPPEIGYSDDGGATWTNVNVGATNARYFISPKTIYVHDKDNIWAVTTGGFVFKSTDAGLTWTAQESGVLSAAGYTCIAFAPNSKLVGVVTGTANTIIRTYDGGVTWSLVTGPEPAVDLNSVAVLDRNRWWVLSNTGKLWYTLDAGATWTERVDIGGNGRRVRFYNDMIGFALANNAATADGEVWMTRDGGYTWERLTTNTTESLNSMAVVSPTLVYAVGEVVSAVAMILRSVVSS